MTAAVCAAAPDDDGEDAVLVLDRALCVCGRLAEVVLVESDDTIECRVVCGCHAFHPAGAEGERR